MNRIVFFLSTLYALVAQRNESWQKYDLEKKSTLIKRERNVQIRKYIESELSVRSATINVLLDSKMSPSLANFPSCQWEIFNEKSGET